MSSATVFPWESQTEKIIIISLITVSPKGVTVGQTRLRPWLLYSEEGADWLKELLQPWLLYFKKGVTVDTGLYPWLCIPKGDAEWGSVNFTLV
jgi:hypothetical protein